MNFERLNDDLLYLIELRNELKIMNFNDEDYDEKEDEVNSVEDAFNEKYGKFLEEVLIKIHQGVAPETDVLLPTAYLAKEYIQTDEDEEGDPIYRIRASEGISVETRFDDDSGNPVPGRIVILPSPLRFALTLDKRTVVLWSSEEPEKFNV